MEPQPPPPPPSPTPQTQQQPQPQQAGATLEPSEMEVEASEDAAKLATEAHERVIRHVAKRILVNKKKALTDLKESVAKLHRLVDKCEQAKQAEIKKNAKRAFKELSDPLKVPALCPAKQKLQFTNYKQLKAVVNSSLRIIKEKHSLDLPDSALEKILVRLSSEKDTHAFCGVCHVFKDVIDKGRAQLPVIEDNPKSPAMKTIVWRGVAAFTTSHGLFTTPRFAVTTSATLHLACELPLAL
eukprot:TRINITY_DN2420_c0_g2_i3.p1 TRINITY_DN2420_c0_g2~~TRINITY_DN2420_c0_g2_i3.p1  ORF type:complete len:248 (-),score=80.05 TRINITY_DN2420_c0_g2_i3:435-1157(-)